MIEWKKPTSNIVSSSTWLRFELIAGGASCNAGHTLSQERPKTMTIHGPTSQYFISQRVRLHYADWGNNAAPPLLLVHGGRDHCRSWDWVAQELSSKWHVIALDQSTMVTANGPRTAITRRWTWSMTCRT